MPVTVAAAGETGARRTRGSRSPQAVDTARGLGDDRALRLAAKIAVTTVAFAICLVAAAGSAAASRRVVLGSASFAAPNGSGWGSAHPRTIFNGGDPSGLVTDVRWRGWGGRTAFAIGRSSIFKPKGGYYPRLVTIELHAVALGRCRAGGPLAYRRLYVREPSYPGGPLGRWLSWSGAKSLCRFGF
jgi:hypothetical protein